MKSNSIAELLTIQEATVEPLSVSMLETNMTAYWRLQELVITWRGKGNTPFKNKKQK
jgi:hypothetical protein